MKAINNKHGVFLLSLVLTAVLPAVAPAAGKEVKLTFSPATPANAVFTARDALGRPMRIKGDTGEITVAGKKVAIKAISQGRTQGIQVDCNGDGTFTPDESRPVTQNRTAIFKIKLDAPVGGSTLYPVILKDLYVYARRGKVSLFSCRPLPGWSAAGTAGSDKIRLVDVDMNGRFTQDGADAIAVGAAQCAMPLVTRHAVGGKICDLAVKADGTALTVAPVAGVATGAARLRNEDAHARHVFITDGRQAYDVIADGKNVPAGEYAIAYGIFTDGNYLAVMLPDKQRYPLKAGALNVLNVGTPVELRCTAKIKGGRIVVSPTMPVVGIGGESYRFIPDRAGKPYVRLMQGKKLLGRAKFDKG